MSKEIIFNVILETGDYKEKLEQIGQASSKASDGVDNLDKSTKTLGTQLKEGVGFSEYIKGADEVSRALKDQQKVVKETENDLKKLNKILENAAPGKVQQELQREVNAANKILKEEKAILEALQNESKKLAKEKQALTSKARELKNELVKLELAGKRDTDQFRALSDEAAKLTASISSVNKSTKTLASSTIVFDAFSEGVQAIAGGFSAAQGAAALFGSENEEVGKALLKVQGALALTNGLQAIFNSLKKQSALVTKANTAATVVASAVMRAFGASVSTTATSFKVLRAAIISTGLGAVVVLLGTIISKFSDVGSSVKEATDEAEKFNSKLKEINDTSKQISDELFDATLDLAVARLNLSKNAAQDIKDEKKLNEQIKERLDAAKELLNTDVESLGEAKALLKAEIAVNEASKQTLSTQENQIESTNNLIDAKLNLAKEEAKPVDSKLSQELQAIEKLETDIDNLRKTFEARVQARKATIANEDDKKRKEQLKKQFDDEQKAIEAFRKIVFGLFEGTLDEEEKLTLNSEKEKYKLRQAFLLLSKKEQEEQAINLANAILQIEENLQNDIIELNQKTRKKIFDDQQKAIEDAKKLRLADLDEEALGIENQLSEAAELRTGSFRSELNFINVLRNNENLRYENEKRQLEEIGASEETLNEARLRNRANLRAIDDEEFNLRKQREEEILNASVNAANSFFNLRSTLINKELSETQRANQIELDNFQGTEGEKKRLQDRFAAEEKQIKTKAAQADRDAAVFNAIINTAVAISKASPNPLLIALAAFTGAAQIAAIKSAPLPKFEKGGTIKGKLHKQGGTIIEAEDGEEVIRRKPASKYRDVLKSINKNDGSFERLIFKKFILPETLGLDKKQNILVNASLKSDKLENEMRKNRKQEIENTKVLASLLKSNQSLSNRLKW